MSDWGTLYVALHHPLVSSWPFLSSPYSLLRRSDCLANTFHHLVTLSLLVSSWAVSLTRVWWLFLVITHCIVECVLLPMVGLVWWFGLIWFVDLDSGCWWWIPISDPQPSSLKRRNLNIVCIIIILLFLFAATAALLYIFWYWTDCKNNENSRNATTITWSPLPPPRTQVGCLIMLLHDTSDVFLELAKVRDDDVCVTTYHSWWRTYDFGSSSIFISLSICEMKNRFE